MSRTRIPFVLLVVAVLGLGAYACRGRGEREAAPRPAPAAPSGPDKLVGQWMRTDGEYMLSIGSFSPDGKLAARYLNPQPINVSRAEWKQADARLLIMVELQDRGYPGSFYELTYDAVSDGLSGVYHHLGLNQDFEVAFYRRDAEAKNGEAAR